jgi:hypothetical protein
VKEGDCQQLQTTSRKKKKKKELFLPETPEFVLNQLPEKQGVTLIGWA